MLHFNAAKRVRVHVLTLKAEIRTPCYAEVSFGRFGIISTCVYYVCKNSIQHLFLGCTLRNESFLEGRSDLTNEIYMVDRTYAESDMICK